MGAIGQGGIGRNLGRKDNSLGDGTLDPDMPVADSDVAWAGAGHPNQRADAHRRLPPRGAHRTVAWRRLPTTGNRPPPARPPRPD